MDVFLERYWPWGLAAVDCAIAVPTASHAVLRKRDPRGALSWVLVIWLAPFLGSLLYLWLGINRIERRAQRLRPSDAAARTVDRPEVPADAPGYAIPTHPLRQLAELAERMTGLPLCAGNCVRPFVDGDSAYAAMLAAIDQATRSVSLCVYIFANDRAGRAFADALIRAADRGIHVRVLVDDVGSGYSWRSGPRLLDGSNVRLARFIPSLTPWQFRYSNLRNHRKILVVDGSIGFTGGMNITQVNYRDEPLVTRAQDTHFELRGPIVHQLQDCFALDWSFTTGEDLSGDTWYGAVRAEGAVPARVISDGPDEDLDRLLAVIQGAISCATSRILVCVSYFVPDYALISALNTAARKGVQVDIVLPLMVDVRLVRWASVTVFSQLLSGGCRIWLTQPPFDHSKLAVIDHEWSLIGSANWDQRGLRLNFEMNVECYDRALATDITRIIESRMEEAIRVTPEWLEQRSLLVRLRDGLARLASPYL